MRIMRSIRSNKEYYTLNWLLGRLLLVDAFQTYIRYL